MAQKGRKGGGSGRRRPEGRPGRNERVVVGVHPVRELLRAERPVRRILVDRDRTQSDTLEDLLARAVEAAVEVREVARTEIDDRAQGLVHQGVLAVAPPFPYVDLSHLANRAEEAGEALFVIALDHVTDPHNVGSIARTAEAAGAHGMVLPDRRAAAITPTVEKAAAGALAHLPVVRTAGFSSALRTLKQDSGAWVVGLDAAAEEEISACPLLEEPIVLVVGSEGSGLVRTSQLHCDMLVRLPMRGQVGSLNASVAAAIALYEVRARRDTPSRR